MSILGKIFGDANERYVRSLTPMVEKINSLEPEFEKLSDEELKDKTEQFRQRLNVGNRGSTPVAAGVEPLSDTLPEAFAAVREAAKRTLGQRHFDVQLIGGMVLHQGKIAEMRTGEGKTLVATLPLYLNALTGKGAHLITPNDYLSRIGAGWMGPVYHLLGVSVGVITNDMSGIYDPEYQDSQSHGDERLSHFRPCARYEAYGADITYGTNNEFGFDYLRDNLEYSPENLRHYRGSTSIVGGLASGYHYAIVDEIDSILIDEARTPLIISAPDEESAEFYQVFSRITPQLKEGADYNVDEKFKAVAITEEGINKVEKILKIGNIYEEKGARFVRYLESALRAKALFLRDRDYVVRDGQVIIVDEFTGRLMPGRRWSEGLHQAVEAKEGVQVQKESRTLATVTFQNYFRMYGKLAGMTGTAQTSAEEFHKVYNLEVITIPTHSPMIREDKADLIFRTEDGKLRAVAREVKERHQKGQPVLIGTVSIEKNERIARMLEIEGVQHSVLNAKNHEQEALIIAQAGRKGAVTVATNMAGRGVDIILGGTPPRQIPNLPRTEPEVLVRGPNPQIPNKSQISNSKFQTPNTDESEEVRQLGGLHVIGTGRHEARRIDNQLRGRAGRQGDSGSSQFFVSLEDDLMRVFGSDKIKRMMETLGIPEDQPIEHKMVSKALEAAQGKIEGFHFDSRKHVLEFDDVLNKQRDAIYGMRREILFSEKPKANSQKPIGLRERIFEMFEEEITRLVEFHTQSDSTEEWNIEEIFETMRAIAGVSDEVHQELQNIAVGSPTSRRKSDFDAAGDRKSALVEYLYGILQKQYEEREKTIGQDGMRNIEKAVMLRSIDMLWMEHLDQMEHLRDSVRLRAYGQRDPLVEYKHEGTRLFRELQAAIRTQTVNMIFKVGGAPRQEQMRRVEERRPQLSPTGVMGFTREPPQQQLGSGAPKLGAREPGRNDPCPCGSGKKFKRCHGA